MHRNRCVPDLLAALDELPRSAVELGDDATAGAPCRSTDAKVRCRNIAARAVNIRGNLWRLLAGQQVASFGELSRVGKPFIPGSAIAASTGCGLQRPSRQRRGGEQMKSPWWADPSKADPAKRSVQHASSKRVRGDDDQELLVSSDLISLM